ncbi:MAG: PD40 domain-containing protein, partial [Nitrospirae bacterium]|nr:PD40 domain-containing protein [Nitrospirota bacterium]
MIRLNKLIVLNEETVIRLLMVFSLTLFIAESAYAEDKAVKGKGLPDYIVNVFGAVAASGHTGKEVDVIKVKALSDIAAGYNESNPKWSPTGEIIAYERASGDNKEIIISSVDGAVLDRLLLDSEGRRKQKKAEDFFLDEMNDIDASYNANFSWSPDGKRFVFMSNSSKGDYDIFIGGIKTGLKRIAGHK